MRIGDYDEKHFIQEVLGPAAVTASLQEFDDAVTIDLAPIVGLDDAPLLVYSIDHPSFVKHQDATIDAHRFYGRWVAGVTCNDIIAMGARCRGFALDLSAPPDTDTGAIEQLMVGINDVLSCYGANYEGGNFDANSFETVGMAWGTVERHAIVRRRGARLGDLLVVTGTVGLGWLEYQLRKSDLLQFVNDADTEALRSYKALPIVHMEAIASIADNGIWSSGMDLSDGLVEFVHTIVDRNDGLGCTVFLHALPVSEAVRRNAHLFTHLSTAVGEAVTALPQLIGLEAGYDSPLCHAFTLCPTDFEHARKAMRASGGDLFAIGEVTDTGNAVLDTSRGTTILPRFWDDQLRNGSTFDAWSEFVLLLASAAL